MERRFGGGWQHRERGSRDGDRDRESGRGEDRGDRSGPERLDSRIEQIAASDRWLDGVQKLTAFRGISTRTASA